MGIKMGGRCVYIFALRTCLTGFLCYAEKVEDIYINNLVTDYANLIHEADEQDIRTVLDEYQKTNGHQLLVVTISNMDGDYIEHRSIKLAEKIKAGDAKHDNGAILLIVKDEKKMRIEVGYGLEHLITDGVSSRIIRDILRPGFQAGTFGSAIQEAVGVMIDVSKGESYPIASKGKIRGEVFLFGLYGLFRCMVGTASVLGRTKTWRLGGILGACIGVILVVILGWIFTNILRAIGITLFGFIFDYHVSKHPQTYKNIFGNSNSDTRGGRFEGGGTSSGSSGFFSGGGGSFGGGGASGDW